MKRIFSLVALGLSTLFIFTACNGNDTKTNIEDDKPVVKRELSDNAGGLNIRFYIQDSIATQFGFYREIDSLLKSKEKAYHSELEKKVRAYQAYEANIQKRMENNEITGFQLEDIQREAMQKQQTIQQFEQQRGEELQRESMQYQLALMNKVAQAGEEFSNENGIDLLLFYQKGGQITYVNEGLDVTDEFISYLNKREGELKSGFQDEVDALENEVKSMEEGGLK